MVAAWKMEAVERRLSWIGRSRETSVCRDTDRNSRNVF